MTFRIGKGFPRQVKIAAVCFSAAACTGVFASAALGATGAPNSAASCTGQVANFASQFGSANGLEQASLAKLLQPIGQQISPTSQQHLGSYAACIS
jgi:hypothetical protein